MERNHIIGIVLIIAVLFLWNQFFFQPEMQEQARKKKESDSIELIQKSAVSENKPAVTQSNPKQDSIASIDTSIQFPDKLFTLENPLIKLELNTRGGVIKEATIKNHLKIN